jgi:sodium/bile acid cotransporter 7
MVFVGAVHCGERIASLEHDSIVSAGNVALMIVAVAGVHILLLVLAFGVSGLLRMPRADSIAVAFSGSQKTMMVGAYLALAVGPLAILPMVAYHASQLVVDTLVADWLRPRMDQTSVRPKDTVDPFADRAAFGPGTEVEI